MRCEQFGVAFRIFIRHHLENVVSCSSFQFTLFFERRGKACRERRGGVRGGAAVRVFCFQNIVQSFETIFHVLVILLK